MAQGLMTTPVGLPETGRGRKSAAKQAEYDAQLDAFAARLLEIRSSLDFTPGSRGWCYLLEQYGVIGKSQFKRTETLINDFRKSGRLPLDFCASDEKRAPVNLTSPDEEDPREFAESYARLAADCWSLYTPISYWDHQPAYIEMAVEKIDLRTLFEKTCAKYHVPIWNAGGWSDINSRAELMARFREHEEAGRHCVLLYCGDFDPAGLLISQTIRKNLMDLQGAVGWTPDEDRLTIERFGLNYDFIVANGLSWIEGLETGGGKYNLEDPNHPDHFKPYVQEYLAKYGARKVEANALVAQYQAGRQLCEDAILQYIDPVGSAFYRDRIDEERAKVRILLPDVMQELLDEAESN